MLGRVVGGVERTGGNTGGLGLLSGLVETFHLGFFGLRVAPPVSSPYPDEVTDCAVKLDVL